MGPGGDGPTIPKPADPPNPGAYRRPYITDGTASETAVARDVAVTSPNRPVDASDFTRGPLTDGQQRSFADKMRDFHDALVTAMPDLCRMDAPNPPYGTGDRSFIAPDPSGWFGDTRQPAGSFERPPSIGHIDNGQGNLPKPITPPAPAAAPGEKTANVTQYLPSGEAVITPVSQADIEAAVTKAVEPYVGKVADLEHLVEEMAGQGDPAQRADRGTARFRGKVVSLGPTAKQARRQAERERRQEEDNDYWFGVARTGSAEQRTRAIRKLARRGIDIDEVVD
jgi:hypothetical protein